MRRGQAHFQEKKMFEAYLGLCMVLRDDPGRRIKFGVQICKQRQLALCRSQLSIRWVSWHSLFLAFSLCRQPLISYPSSSAAQRRMSSGPRIALGRVVLPNRKTRLTFEMSIVRAVFVTSSDAILLYGVERTGEPTMKRQRNRRFQIKPLSQSGARSMMHLFSTKTRH